MARPIPGLWKRDITDDIMSPSALRKLRREVSRLRAGTPNVGQLQRLARKLGRKLFKRGKEPTWVNTQLPGTRPLSIPDHPSIPRPTAQSILSDLESDLFAWEEILEAQRRQQEGARHGKGSRKSVPKKALRQDPGAD